MDDGVCKGPCKRLEAGGSTATSKREHYDRDREAACFPENYKPDTALLEGEIENIEKTIAAGAADAKLLKMERLRIEAGVLGLPFDEYVRMREREDEDEVRELVARASR